MKLHVKSVSIIAAGAIVTAAATIAADELPQSLISVKKALLAEDWAAVANVCGPEDSLGDQPIMRAIKGHACLALNRNDESLTLFLSIANQPDRAVWKKWATDFAAANPKNPVALYLKGDALARMGNWKAAIEAYSAALYAKKDFALALNARGVAWASLKEYDKARDDMDAAIAGAPTFADAYASLANLKLLKGAPDTAITDYSRALSNSTAFGLAHNGRACARVRYSRDAQSTKRALQDYSEAARCPSVARLVAANIEVIAHAIERADAPTLKTAEGMTLSANHFRFMDIGSQNSTMRDLSRQELTAITDRAYKNYLHSKTWGEAFQYLSGIGDSLGLNFSGLAEQSFRHAREHMDIFNRGNSWLNQNFGTHRIFDSAGGVGTDDIGAGYGDQDAWAVKSWFGLAQQTEYPVLPPRNPARKE